MPKRIVAPGKVEDIPEVPYGTTGRNYWGGQSKTGRDWNESKGRFAKDPEAAREASRIGNKVRWDRYRQKKRIEGILLDKKEILDESLESLLEDNPDLIKEVMKSLAEQAKNGDKQAAAVFLEHSGFKAPKQTEVKVEEKKMSEEDAVALLRAKMKSV